MTARSANSRSGSGWNAPTFIASCARSASISGRPAATTDAAARPATRPDGLYRAIVDLFRDNPGEHFTACDVSCLLHLAGTPRRTDAVEAHLDELTAWRVLQRIRVTGMADYYDVDTRRHVRVLDAARGALFDLGALRGAAPPRFVPVSARRPAAGLDPAIT